MTGRQIVFHVRIQPKFKNRGFKSGHVETVEIKPIGLTISPERVDVIYLDRKPLRWWETREIRCEFLAVVRFRFPDDPPEPSHGYTSSRDRPTSMVPPIKFGASFRGPDGREIHWQQTTVYMAFDPSQPSPPPGRKP